MEQKQQIEAKGLRKFFGLMFRNSKTNPLIFNFKNPVMLPIHSLFVFFPFTARWTFEDGTIEEEIIKPFKNNIKPSKKFIKLEEIPIDIGDI